MSKAEQVTKKEKVRHRPTEGPRKEYDTSQIREGLDVQRGVGYHSTQAQRPQRTIQRKMLSRKCGGPFITVSHIGIWTRWSLPRPLMAPSHAQRTPPHRKKIKQNKTGNKHRRQLVATTGERKVAFWVGRKKSRITPRRGQGVTKNHTGEENWVGR